MFVLGHFWYMRFSVAYGIPEFRPKALNPITVLVPRKSEV